MFGCEMYTSFFKPRWENEKKYSTRNLLELSIGGDKAIQMQSRRPFGFLYCPVESVQRLLKLAFIPSRLDYRTITGQPYSFCCLLCFNAPGVIVNRVKWDFPENSTSLPPTVGKSMLRHLRHVSVKKRNPFADQLCAHRTDKSKSFEKEDSLDITYVCDWIFRLFHEILQNLKTRR